MESIQQQISSLTRKVDQVYEVIDRLNQHIVDSLDSQLASSRSTSVTHPLSTADLQRVGGDSARLSQEINRYRTSGYADLPSRANYRHDTAEWVIAQQDVLIDSSGVEISHHQIKEQDLSPQIQIQRLTAQLTAAYNRIAALEEQLLANRWK
jgi:chromosome segregation ATPase